jgi:tetratricopeptide (TPR) repeat protein
MLFRSFAIVSILLFGSLAVLAQAPPSTAQAAVMSDADRQRFDTLREAGFTALYNLDYALAKHKFSELAAAFPTHPAGPQFLATALWTEQLNKSRRLSASLYGSDSFFESSEDKPDPALVMEFRGLIRNSINLSKARLRADPKDVEALYNLGSAQGLRAAFSVAVERKFLGSLGDASDCVDRHREVIKLDPLNHDAELTIGLYDYVVGSLPTPIKILASIGGFRGSKKRGIATLERVSNEAKWNQDNALSVLIILYKRENRFADALKISRQLSEKYPRNYLFKLETADALSVLATEARAAGDQTTAETNERQAFAIFDALLQERGKGVPAAAAADFIHFRYGDILLTAGQTDRAAREYLAAAKVPGAEPDLVTLSLLNAGQALDLSGKREDAMAQYRAVLTRPDVYEAHEQAKQGLKAPYRPKPVAHNTGE